MIAPVLHVYDSRDSDWRPALCLHSQLRATDTLLASSDLQTRQVLKSINLTPDGWLSSRRGSARSLERAIRAHAQDERITVWGDARQLTQRNRTGLQAVAGACDNAASLAAKLWHDTRAVTREQLRVRNSDFAIGFASDDPVDVGFVSRTLGVLNFSGLNCVGVALDSPANGLTVRGSLRGIRFAEEHAHSWRVVVTDSHPACVFSAIDALVWFSPCHNATERPGFIRATLELAHSAGAQILVDTRCPVPTSDLPGTVRVEVKPTLRLASELSSIASKQI